MKTVKEAIRASLPEAISDLFVVAGSPKDRESHGLAWSQPGFSFEQVLDKLSLTASCFLAPLGGRVPEPGLMEYIEPVREHLIQYPFCQINLRPVHCVPSDSEGIDGFVEFYSTLRGIVRPFEEEGFRNQIVSRLRIFPILWFPEPRLFRGAGPVLKYLQENFFLPSLYVAQAQIGEWDFLLGKDGEAGPFERVYVGTGAALEPDKILEDLFLTCLIERFMSYELVNIVRGDVLIPCNNMIYFLEDGSNKPCLLGLPSTMAPEACSRCVLSGLASASVAFKKNGRIHEFGYLCERIGAWLFETGNREGALETWSKAVAECPDHETSNEVLIKRALCHYEKQELESAMECLKTALSRDPDSAEIRYQMGLCEYGWRDYIEAADRFEEAVRLGLSGGLKTEAEYMRGLSHYHIEEYEEAIEALEKALAGGKRDTPVYFYLGLAWLGRGNPEKALAFLLEALSSTPSAEDLFHVLFYVAHALKELGRYEDALEYLKRAESMGQARKEVMNLSGFCLFKLARYDEAIECFRTCLEVDPRSAIDWANIGSCLRDKGDRQGAIAMYRKALSLDPGIEFARESLARLADEGGAA